MWTQHDADRHIERFCAIIFISLHCGSRTSPRLKSIAQRMPLRVHDLYRLSQSLWFALPTFTMSSHCGTQSTDSTDHLNNRMPSIVGKSDKHKCATPQRWAVGCFAEHISPTFDRISLHHVMSVMCGEPSGKIADVQGTTHARTLDTMVTLVRHHVTGHVFS